MRVRLCNTSVASCGACGAVCPTRANGSATCGVACDAGLGNCDGPLANGCEVRTTSESLNYGRCGLRCSVGQACSAGVCVSSCPSGMTFCGGGCVSTQTDSRHCVACGAVCASGSACSAGVCRPVPPANDTLAGAATLSLATGAFDFTATSTNARNDIQVPSQSPTTGASPDVFYRFVLSRCQRSPEWTRLCSREWTYPRDRVRNPRRDLAAELIAHRKPRGVSRGDGDATATAPSSSRSSLVVVRGGSREGASEAGGHSG